MRDVHATKAASGHGGFARLALVWLVACLATGGFLALRGLRAISGSKCLAPAATIAAPPPAVGNVLRTKPIEQVVAGDRVLAYDPAAGRWERREVVRPMSRDYVGDLVTVTVAGSAVEATGNHPFWVEAGQDLVGRPPADHVPWGEQSSTLGGRWVSALHLQPGDMVALAKGRVGAVSAVAIRRAEATVYNLEVAGLHTYAVGPAGVAVHNCGPALAIGRVSDLTAAGGLRPGEFRLTWPKEPTPKANWEVNYRLLRSEFRAGRPIRDASPGDKTGQFLNAERLSAENRGWTLDQNGFWVPPG